jgi:hypothetical protein
LSRCKGKEGSAGSKGGVKSRGLLGDPRTEGRKGDGEPPGSLAIPFRDMNRNTFVARGDHPDPGIVAGDPIENGEILGTGKGKNPGDLEGMEDGGKVLPSP